MKVCYNGWVHKGRRTGHPVMLVAPSVAMTLVVAVSGVRAIRPILLSVPVAVVGSAQVGGTAGPLPRSPQELLKESAFVLTVA